MEDRAKEDIAKESAKTLRDRRKLIARFELIDQQITGEALEAAASRIRDRINRLASFRVPLGNTFELFDSNENPKELSDRVQKIATHIKDHMQGLYPQLNNNAIPQEKDS